MCIITEALKLTQSKNKREMTPLLGVNGTFVIVISVY